MNNKKFLLLPLAMTCLFLGVFVFIFFDLSFKAKLLLFLIFTSIGIISALLSIKLRGNIHLLYITLICISGVLAICSLTVGNDIPKNEAQKYLGNHKIEGYFTSVHYVSDYSSAHFAHITKIDGNDASFNTYIFFSERLPENNFKYFETEVEFEDISNFCSLNMTEKAFASKKIHVGCTALSLVQLTDREASGIIPFFSRLNTLICNRVSYILSEENAGLVCALLFGDRSLLPPTLERDFMTLGITHMLVVSGMNIALIAGEFDLIFSVLTQRKRLRTLLCCTICLFYMALCGFALSVVRAAIMQIIYKIAPNAAREYDSHTSLFLALGIIVLISPGAVFDIGFLLSFFATLGIISYNRFISGELHQPKSSVASVTEDSLYSRIIRFIRTKPVLRDLISSLIASFSACIFVLPISFIVFGGTSLACAIFTLLFSPLLDALLYLTPILILTSYIPFLGNVIALVGEFTCNGVYKLSQCGQIFKELYVSFDDTFIIGVILLISSVVFAFLYKTKRKFLKILPSILIYILISILLLFNASKEGLIYYTDTEGEAFISSTDRGNMMVDISCGTRSFIKRCTLSSSKSDLAVTNIDTYLITHTNINHIRSVHTLATDGYLSTVLMPEPVDDDDITVFNELSLLSLKYGFDLISYPNEKTLLDLCGTDITLYPHLEDSHKGEHDVIYFEISFDKNKAVYLGQNIADTDFCDHTVFEGSSAIVIGSHYPTVKIPFSYRFYPENALVFAPEKISHRFFANVDIIPVPESDCVHLF